MVPTPHIGGPILGGSPDVITGGQSQSRVGDAAQCNGPLDAIKKGSDTVFVNGKQAARDGDPTDEGHITSGLSSVLIGDSGGGDGGTALADASDNATPFSASPDLSDPFENDPLSQQGDAFDSGSDGAPTGGDGGTSSGSGDGAAGGGNTPSDGSAPGGAPGAPGMQTMTISCPAPLPGQFAPPDQVEEINTEDPNAGSTSGARPSDGY
jgi:uncharacterized Zn-binding protein involved in type VI secretion